jgi:penicillin-binding protein 1A
MSDKDNLWTPGSRRGPARFNDAADAPRAREPNETEPVAEEPRGEPAEAAPDVESGEPDVVVAPRKAPRPDEARERGGGPPGWLKFIGFAFGAVAIAALAGAGGAAFYLNKLSQDLPDYKRLAEYSPPVTTRVYGGDGSLVAEFARERRLFVPISAIPDHVKFAFVSAEDKSFYEHSGLDTKGMVRAAIANVSNYLQGRRLEGGSTITQQVAKNFLLSNEQKLERKLREMLVTRRIEKAFTKDHILELYLNEIYLGNRSYGVAAAALNYFNKSLDELTVADAAYLAVLPKAPNNYHPIDKRERALGRRNWVIERMFEDGRIDAAGRDAALAAPLDAVMAPPLGARDWASEYFAEEVRKEIAARYGTDALYDGGLAVRTTLDPELQAAAAKALRHWLVEYDQRHGWRGPAAKIEVSEDWAPAFAETVKSLADRKIVAEDLDPWRPALVLSAGANAAQIGFVGGEKGRVERSGLVWARALKGVDSLGPEVAAVSEVLEKGDVILVEPATDEAGAPIAGVFALRQVPAVNGAFIAIDPHTGRVLAMVGGFSFQLSEFNRALQALRQPGSTFKPFVYAAALDNGYTPSSIVLDAPFVAPGVDSWWKPGNYQEGRFYGESTLRLGLEQSRNTMTARLAQDLGIGRIVDYVARFRLSERMPRELAISLGASETTLMKITAAYAIFVNGGKRVEPVFIDRIQDRDGKTVYRRDERLCEGCVAEIWTGQGEPQLADEREQVMDPRTAYQIVSMLEGAVQRGTGSAVRKVVDKPVAGKTGTTNEYRDAWFVGFSPDLVAGVFVGFDMPAPLGQGEAGGRVAAPIFGEFMARALAERAAIPFRVPSGVRLVRVNAKSGRPAGSADPNVILEAFKAEDSISEGPSADDFDLGGLSSSPPPPPADAPPADDLTGLY